MTKKVDKIIVTNFAGLRSKYGAKGASAIRVAIKVLVNADKTRGLQTVVVGIDNKSQMKSLSAAPVTHPLDCRQNKNAIDAVYQALVPDYIMLLGSHDVIPHQDLKKPFFKGRTGDDPDKFAWGPPFGKTGRDDASSDDGSGRRRRDCPNVPPHDR
jgi:hypothetical protein